jgi:hypothetical protein
MRMIYWSCIRSLPPSLPRVYECPRGAGTLPLPQAGRVRLAKTFSKDRASARRVLDLGHFAVVTG